MVKTWGWVWLYGIAIVAALLLGAHLGDLPRFQEMRVGDANLPAPKLVQFTGHVVALLLFWMLSRRAVSEIPADGKRFSFLRLTIPPLTLLLVFMAGYRLMRPVAGLYLDGVDRRIYNLIFLLGTLGAVLWLTVTWRRNWALLTPTKESRPAQRAPAPVQEPTQAQPETPRASRPLSQRDKPLETDKTLPLPARPSSSRKERRDDATVPIERPSIRSKLGRYAVIKELGRGAMGIVYLGKDPTIQRHVALKTVRFDEVDEPGQLPDIKMRFFREAESTGRLSHPHIVTIFDAGEEEGLGYIAMEVLDGITLKDWCRKENLQPIKKVLELVAKVAEALDHAHKQGVVHRDIKPANIMITKDGAIKVTDFGIARLTTSTKTQTNVILGTPSYMSPEQVAGEKVDGRSDLFSLGVVLYELLTGERPFQGESIASLIFQIANKPHRPPAQLRADMPPGCVAIIDRALCKEVDQRYQSGLEFAVDLSVCLQALPD
jgi:serine/threonine-protein kinase